MTDIGFDNEHHVPADRTAARVISTGFHWEPEPHWQNVHSETPLPMRKPANDEQRSLLGVKFGRFLVLGVAVAKNRIGTLYVCRCLCGRHEHKTPRAIRNPKNGRDACSACRLIASHRKHNFWLEYGVSRDQEEFL